MLAALQAVRQLSATIAIPSSPGIERPSTGLKTRLNRSLSIIKDVSKFPRTEYPLLFALKTLYFASVRAGNKVIFGDGQTHYSTRDGFFPNRFTGFHVSSVL